MSIELSETLKQKGNEAFAKNEVKKAAKIYRDAIKLNPKNPVLYSNRAICFIKLKDFERALKDCDSGLDLSQDLKTTIKLHYRRYLSLSGLGNLKEARLALEKAKVLDPSNKLITDELKKISNEGIASPKTVLNPDNLRSIDIIRVDEIPNEFQIKEVKLSKATLITNVDPKTEENKTTNQKTIESLDSSFEDWKDKKLRFFGDEI